MKRSRPLPCFVMSSLVPLLLVAGCKAKQDAAPETAVTVQAERPTVGEISEEIAADAILAPLSQAAIAPRISAPIRAEYVQRGARVKKGQLLVSLEARDLKGATLDTQGSLLAARANYTATANATVPDELTRAQADVTQAQSARDVANRTASERQRLYSQGALSGRDADMAVAAAAQAEAAYQIALKHLGSVRGTTERTSKESAKGQVESAQGRLLSAEAQMSYADLRSPIAGVVTERPLFPGETASAGTPIVTVMDTSSLLAKLHVAQATAQKLSLGHHAELAIPGMDEPVQGTVSFISPALDPGSTTVEVWLKLPNADGHLKVGTPVHATIVGNSVANAVRVPKEAILPAQDGGTNIMVVGADGKAHKRAVKVGIRTDEEVQILSGVSPTETVVTGGGYGLDDGTKVEIGKAGATDDKDRN